MPETASRGQLEAAVGEVVNQFIRQRIGRGATTVSATVERDVMMVHLRGVLTTIEEKLLASTTGGDASRSLVREMRSLLVETSRQELLGALASAVGSRPASMLHDLDVDSGDEVFVFRLHGSADRTPRIA